MSSPGSNPATLSAQQQDRLAEIVARFEHDRQQGNRPPLEEYLPDEPVLRDAALRELIRADLEFRIEAGEPARVEIYLERYPELARQTAFLVNLVVRECRLRQRQEAGVCVAHYLERFPQLREQLEARLQMDARATHTGQTTANWQPRSEPGPPGTAAPPLPRIPGYEVLAVLGRGGMGIVYKARHLRLQRLVALKMILAGAHAGPEHVERFLVEARAVARMQHPHIVQIYEIGEHGGLPFFSLEFVDGGSLDKKPARAPRDAAALVETLARAMHTAHQAGVVHRDLKPANVLLTEEGTPKITDFGLAKQLDAESGQTRTGAVMGTPAYMAPEQAAGRTHEIGPATDVYALGAILYELLTGRPPFRGASIGETLAKVQREEPTAPSRLRPKLPRDVETICLKCLAKEPGQRYPSALALAQDLERFRSDEPILARRQSLAARFWRKVRRRPLQTAAVVAVLLAVVAGTLGAFRSFHLQRVDQLETRIQTRLQALDGTPAAVNEVESAITELEGLDAARAGVARQALVERLARHLEDRLREDVIRPEDRPAIDAALELLAARDPESAGRLRQTRDRRYTGPQKVIALKPPFPGLGEVFDRSRVRADPAGFVRPLPAGGGKTVTLLTREGCKGQVRLEATFAGVPKLGPDGDLGLLLNAEQGPGGELSGYAFILANPAGTDRPGGFVSLRILRNGVLQREETRPLPGGPLRLMARREGGKLEFQLGDAPPVLFQDVLPGSPRDGKFGLRWPPEARLTRLDGYQTPLPTGSPLEQGDALFGSGRYGEALAFYEQHLRTGTPRARHEAECKAGLCLLALRRTGEAAAYFERVAAAKPEEGEPWPLVATVQRWLLYVREEKFDLAEPFLTHIQVNYPHLEDLLQVIPADVRFQILDAYGRQTSLADNLLTPTAAGVAERYVAVGKALQAPPGRMLPAYRRLTRVYALTGQEEKALQTAQDALLVGDTWPGSMAEVPEEYCWLLRRRRGPERALEEINRRLAAAAAGPGRQASDPGLLLERARTFIALQKWDDAEKDVALVVQGSHYYVVCQAALLQGFLRERRGDEQGALAAWRGGVFKRWGLQLPPSLRESGFGGGPNPFIHDWILASLTNDLADSAAEELLPGLASKYGFAADSSPRKLIGVLRPPPALMAGMWRTRLGRQCARHIAFRDVSLSDYFHMPLFLVLAEYLRQGSTGDSSSAEEEALIWDLAQGGVQGYTAGKLGITHATQLLAAWKGYTNFLGWGGVAPQLDASLRGPTAYVLGVRYLRVKNMPKEAEAMFRAALADTAPETPLHRLARGQLERLKGK
jgi:tetratricopeptide (TPR) repeat protein